MTTTSTTGDRVTPGRTGALRRRSPGLVIGLCFAAIVFDGYDLIVYGAIVPELLGYTEWGLTEVDTGRIGSLALLGMLIGALSIGYLTDVVGRRRVMIASVTVFSVLMLACALAPTPFWFGTFRFLAGLGLGGVIPTAIALTVEYSQPHRRNVNNALMFCGYAVGGILSALLALALLDVVGFRGLLAIGALPLVTIVPLLSWLLPESPSYLRAQGRTREAAELRATYGLGEPPAVADSEDTSTARSRVDHLFRGRWLVALVLFCLAGVAGQSLIYGLSTWLPQLMVVAGYSVDSSLAFLLTVNIGAAVGVVASSWLADRLGPRPVTAASFVASGTALVLMGTGLAPLPVMFALVAVVGFGSIGAQILVNGFVAVHYPDVSRASALGVTLGLGRIGAVIAIYGGGVLVAAQLGDFVNFAVWGVAALVGLVAVLAVPRPSPS